MRKIGFDNGQYVRLQSERIRQRINKFGGKLYLELGGKLFDDSQRPSFGVETAFGRDLYAQISELQDLPVELIERIEARPKRRWWEIWK